MKKYLSVLLFCVAFILCAGDKFIRPTVEVLKVKNFSPANGLKSSVWSKAKEYPFMLNAGLPQEFALLPAEEGKVSFLCDEKNMYVRAVMNDSEVLSEAVDSKSQLLNCADTFFVVLRPLSDSGFFYILCTPNAIVSATYVAGAGSIRLASANTVLETKIPVYTSINGKINDGKKDKFWSALLVLPIEKLAAEVQKKCNINVRESEGWSVMAGRKNFTRFLNELELSGYPQPVRGFFTMHHHARFSVK